MKLIISDTSDLDHSSFRVDEPDPNIYHHQQMLDGADYSDDFHPSRLAVVSDSAGRHLLETQKLVDAFQDFLSDVVKRGTDAYEEVDGLILRR